MHTPLPRRPRAAPRLAAVQYEHTGAGGDRQVPPDDEAEAGLVRNPPRHRRAYEALPRRTSGWRSEALCIALWLRGQQLVLNQRLISVVELYTEMCALAALHTSNSHGVVRFESMYARVQAVSISMDALTIQKPYKLPTKSTSHQVWAIAPGFPGLAASPTILLLLPTAPPPTPALHTTDICSRPPASLPHNPHANLGTFETLCL